MQQVENYLIAKAQSELKGLGVPGGDEGPSGTRKTRSRPRKPDWFQYKIIGSVKFCGPY